MLTISDVALDAIRQYADADNPSAFLAVNRGNSYHRLPDVPGTIVYRAAGDYLVQFGGPFAPEPARARLLASFVDLAAGQGRQIVAVQLQAADAGPYLERGFTVNQIGASYAVDLEAFTLDGTRFMRLRNKISRALRSGLRIREAPLEQWSAEMADLDRAWLAAKGASARPLEFLVGEYGGAYQPLRRLFVATLDDRLMGYVSYAPVYGTRAGWLHDLSRRRPDVAPGTMEAINKAAIDTFQAEGVRWLHFGFTPFAGLARERQLPGYGLAFHWFAEQLFAHGEQVYPARTQLAYKHKWAPSVVLPEYVAFQGTAGIRAFVHIFRACNAL